MTFLLGKLVDRRERVQRALLVVERRVNLAAKDGAFDGVRPAVERVGPGTFDIVRTRFVFLVFAVVRF